MKTYDLAPGRKPGRFQLGRKPLVLLATGNLLPERTARRLLDAGTIVEHSAPPASTPKVKKKATKKAAKKTTAKAAKETS